MYGLPRDLALLIRLFPRDEAGEVVVGDLLECLDANRERGRWSGLAARGHVLRSLVAVWVGRLRPDPPVSLGKPSGGDRFAGWALDALLAIRSYRRRPVLALAVTGSIALGVAATTTALTFVDGVLRAPLPYPNADRIVRATLLRSDGDPSDELSYREIEGLAEVPDLEAISPVARVRLVIPGDQGADRLRGEGVNQEYLALLRPEMTLGRVPGPEAYGPGGAREIVLSHGAWVRAFGARSDVVGETVSTLATTYEIVGVTSPDFFGTTPEDVVDLWVPLLPWMEAETRAGLTGLEQSDVRWLSAIGRVRGTAPNPTGARVGSLGAAWTGASEPVDVRVVPVAEAWRAAVRPGLRLLSATSVCLLLLTCVNVVALMSARLFDRRGEIGVRRALGASGLAVVRGVVAEALVFSAAGTAIGMLAVVWTTPVLSALLLEDLVGWVSVPGSFEPRIGWLTLSAIGATALLVGVSASVAPMVVVGRGAVGGVVGGLRGSAAGGRLPTRALNGVEIALATVLLLAGGLLVRSYERMSAVDPGFRTEGVMKLQVTAGGERYEDLSSREALSRRVLEDIRAVPAVRRAALVAPTAPPLSNAVDVVFGSGPGERFDVDYHLVSEGFFDLLEIPSLAGRPLDEAARGGSRTVVVSRAVADRLGGSSAILGRRLRFGAPFADSIGVEVVGVVENVSYGGVSNPRPAALDLYLPIDYAPPTFFAVVAQPSGGITPELVQALRGGVGGIDRTAAVHWIEPLDQAMNSTVSGLGRRTAAVSVFALMALAMAGLGLYGMMSYNGRRRGGEFAVRLALGASPARVRRSVLREALVTVAVGLGVGLAVSIPGVGLLRSSIFGVGPTDPGTVMTVVFVVAILGAAASVGPAWRASNAQVGAVLSDGSP